MNVGKCPGNPPARNTGEKARKVSGGPKYPKSEVLALLGLHPPAFRVWTVKCGVDIAKLELDSPAVVDIVSEAVSLGKFQGSEWCEQKEDGPWAICDAYVLRRTEWNQAAKKDMRCEYYIKFAIGRSGLILLLISCHPPRV